MNNKSVLTAAVLAGVFPVLSQAQTESESPVVVTASRVAQTADQALANITVITRDEIERRQPVSLLELLRTVPGLDVSRTGGPGQQTSVFLRGTESNHSLVLVDGVRVASATTGLFDWNTLTPDQVERIEIVRGARATLYGSDAIGGVIQIFTRRPRGLTANIEAGSYDSYGAALGYGGGERVRWYLNAAAEQSEGFSAKTSDTERDGWSNQSLTAGFTAPVGRGETELKAWLSESHAEFDPGVSDMSNGSISLRYALPVTNGWFSTVRLSRAQDISDVTENGNPYAYTTYRSGAEWQNDFSIGRSLLVTGLDWYQEDTRATSTWSTYAQDVTNNAAYLNWQGELGPGTLEAGARYNHHSTFGDFTTGQLGWGQDLSDSLRLIAAYGTAFVAPTANDLFGSGGNLNLKPEQSRNAELGLRYRAAPNSSLRASLFHTEVDDMIAFGPAFQVINIDQAVISGAELGWERVAGKWRVDLSATWQDPRDVSDETRLLRRPDRKGSLLVSRESQRGSFTAELLAVGDRIDIGTWPDTTTLASYYLLNLGWQRQLSNGLTVQARVENLTDEQYQLAYGYNTAGRSYYLGVRFAPEQR